MLFFLYILFLYILIYSWNDSDKCGEQASGEEVGVRQLGEAVKREHGAALWCLDGAYCYKTVCFVTKLDEMASSCIQTQVHAKLVKSE